MPGKKFIIFITIIASFVMLLPLTFILFNPWLESPPSFIRNGIFLAIEEAEKDLKNENDNFYKTIKIAEDKLNEICKNFEGYLNSPYYPIFEIRIIVRKFQFEIGVKKNDVEALKIISEFVKKYKKEENLKKIIKRNNSVSDIIQPQIIDMIDSAQHSRINKKIYEQLATLGFRVIMQNLPEGTRK
eukprot:EC826056.1.p1 GENE.EC826056.1~~EC826056.1.p1  ORF type:complete len:186 (+),score=84.48 EC826056.1:96-653(+)